MSTIAIIFLCSAIIVFLLLMWWFFIKRIGAGGARSSRDTKHYPSAPVWRRIRPQRSKSKWVDEAELKELIDTLIKEQLNRPNQPTASDVYNEAPPEPSESFIDDEPTSDPEEPDLPYAPRAENIEPDTEDGWGDHAMPPLPSKKRSYEEQYRYSYGDNSSYKDRIEDLNCTVFSPSEVAAGSTFLIQVFAHSQYDWPSLADIARQADSSTQMRAFATFDDISIGSKIEFTLKLGDLKIEEPTLPTIWKGTLKHLQFDPTIPADYDKPDVIGKILVSVNSAPIGQLKFKISIINLEQAKPTGDINKSVLKKFKNAFISYASADRAEVLKRVQVMELMKLKYFQDLLTLEPGDEWEKKIYEYLNLSDVVFLFWSKAASDSEWVRKEIIYAMNLKSSSLDEMPEIIPVIIEGPPPAKPPAELQSLHFNDTMIYFINQESRMR